MLFYGNSTLLGVHACGRSTGSEFNIEVRCALIEDIPFQRRFHVFVPDVFSVQVQVVTKTACDYNLSPFEFVSQLSRNRESVLVVKFSFEEIHIVMPTVVCATHCNPLKPVYSPYLPTVQYILYPQGQGAK